MASTIIFTPDEAAEKGRIFVRLIEQDVQDRAPAMKLRNYIRNLYFGLRKRKLRYDGQSNIHLPVLAEKIETFVPKEMGAFWSVDPHTHAQRVPVEYDEEETAASERMVNWAIDFDIPNLYQTMESWFRNRHLDGVAAVKAYYNYEERSTVFIEQASTMWHAGAIDLTSQPVPQKRMKVPAEILAAMFTDLNISAAYAGDVDIDPMQEQPLEGLSFRIDFVEGEIQYRDILVEFHPCKYIESIEVYIFRPYPYKDNVEVELVEFEDLIVPFRAKDLQSAERVTQQYWLTVEEIEQRRLYDGWMLDDEDMERLRSRSTADTHEEMPDNKDLSRQKDMVTGQQSSNNTVVRSTDELAKLEPYRSDKVLMFEVHAREDLDQDGIFEDIIYQIPYALEKVVKAQHLAEVFPHERRPFADLHSIPVSGRYYSWSMGQILAPINVEVNAIVNAVNDAQELINNPIFFYVPSALPGDPKLFKNLEPGTGIPIGDPNGIFFPQFPQTPLSNLSAVDSMLLFADRISVSPQAGGSSQVRNAPRTARGTLALLSESGAKIDSFITAAQKGGWAELMYQIYALYDHYASDEKWTRVTGKSRRQRQRTHDLSNRFKFVFKGNTVNTNKEVMRTLAQVRYTILAAEPLYASDPVARRALIENFLQHFSEGADIQKLLPSIPQLGGMRQPMDQLTEVKVMLSGMPVEVIPIDDDGKHMQVIDQYRNSKDFDALTQQQVALLAHHYRQHQQQLLLKQQQNQVPAGGTQANNMPVGAGLNLMEGGVA